MQIDRNHGLGKTVDALCKLCNRPFKARVRGLKKGWSAYCSKKCANTARVLGARNPYYRGGVAYRNSRIPAEQKDRIRIRDNHKCVQCGRPDRIIMTKRKERHYLQIHHVQSVRDKGSDEDWNLVSLCGFCHQRVERGIEELKWRPQRPEEPECPK